MAVRDGADDHRRPAGSIAGRHWQQRSGAVQDADARRPLRCALERRQDRAVCVRPSAPAAARAPPGRSRSARLGQTASLGARSRARKDTRRASTVCSVCGLSAASECVRLRETSSDGASESCDGKSRRVRGVEYRCAFRTLSRALQIGFRIGELHYVEPSLNSVTGPAGTTRLEPKVMQVLVCLAAQAGQVVTKQRLMRTVWPDTFVGDDVLTRCISELRRVFGDDVKEPRFIQTIPKSGYRLIAGVSSNAVQDLAAPGQDAARSRHPPSRKPHATSSCSSSLGVVLLTGIAVGGWWIASTRRGPAGPPRQATLTQLTANPPDLPVTSAQISPDGKYLAYADPTGIQVRVIDTGETQRDRRHARYGGLRLERRRDQDPRRGVRHGDMHRLGSLAGRRHPTPLRGCLARDRCRDPYARRLATTEDHAGALGDCGSTRLTAQRRDTWSISARTDRRAGAPMANGCSSPGDPRHRRWNPYRSQVVPRRWCSRPPTGSGLPIPGCNCGMDACSRS